jgi:hypothetical protein
MQRNRYSDTPENLGFSSINSGTTRSSYVSATGSDDELSDSSPLKRQKCFNVNRDLYRLSVHNSTIQNGSFPEQSFRRNGFTTGPESYHRIDQSSSHYVSEPSNCQVRLSVRHTYPLAGHTYPLQQPATQHHFSADSNPQPPCLQRYHSLFNTPSGGRIGVFRTNSGRSLLDYQAEQAYRRDTQPFEYRSPRTTCLDMLSATRLPFQAAMPSDPSLTFPSLRRPYATENSHRRQQVIEAISNW